MTIATDIICGFPTETENDFEDTLSLCAEYKFPSLFINQFFPRPGTPAARMSRVPTQEVKQRTKRLTDLFNSYQPYNHKIGREQEVLVTEISHDKKFYVGHNKFYEQVLVPMDRNYMGQLVKIKIMEAGKFSMISQPLDQVYMPGISKPLAHGQVSGLPITEEASKISYAIAALVIALFLRFIWIIL